MGWFGFRRDQTGYFKTKLYRSLRVTVDAVCHGPVQVDDHYSPPSLHDPGKLTELVENRVSHIPALVGLQDTPRTREQVILSQIIDVVDENARLNDLTETYVGATSIYFFNNSTLMPASCPIAIALAGTGPEKNNQLFTSLRNLGYFQQFFLMNYHEATFSATRTNQLVNHLFIYEMVLTVKNKLCLFRDERLFLFQENIALSNDLDRCIKNLESVLLQFRSSLINEEYWVTKKDAYREILVQTEKDLKSVTALLLAR